MAPGPSIDGIGICWRDRTRAGRLLFAGFVFLLLVLVVVPLDGEKHARAEHENLEHNEDYRDPIHLFLAITGY